MQEIKSKFNFVYGKFFDVGGAENGLYLMGDRCQETHKVLLHLNLNTPGRWLPWYSSGR